MFNRTTFKKASFVAVVSLLTLAGLNTFAKRIPLANQVRTIVNQGF